MCFPTSLLLLEQCHLLTHSSITGRDFTCDAFCPSGYFAWFNELMSLKRVKIKGGQHQWNQQYHLVLHPMTEGVFISGLVIMRRWQPDSWLASHMLTSTWITISFVCLLFCFPSLTPPPLRYTSLLTLVPAANLTPPVPPCEPVPAPLPYPWPCTRERPVRVQPLQLPPPPLHPSRELHTHPSAHPTLLHQLLSKILTEPQSVCICGCVWARMCARASMHARACLTVIVREGAAGDSAQPILRL